jgi:nickel-dependent lactate racemase
MNQKAKRGILFGNPVNEDMLEIAKLIKPSFLFNTVLNSKRQISSIFTGDTLSAHIKGCEFVKNHYYVSLKEKADLVIVSCGGEPFDLTYYQAHKAIDNIIGCVKDNGVIILVAKCSQGVGSKDFYKWFSYKNLKEIEKNLRKKFVVVGHTAYASLQKALKVNIVFVTNLKNDDIKKL